MKDQEKVNQEKVNQEKVNHLIYVTLLVKSLKEVKKLYFTRS